MKVLVIGLGAVGLPTSEYLSQFYNVYGYDVQPKPSFSKQIPKITKNFDVYVVCVPTSQVYSVCGQIPTTGKIVIIESTVQMGTCRKLASDLGFSWLAHCPHRYFKEEPIKHGVKQTRVLGALNVGTMENVLDFYWKAEIPVVAVSSLELAELTKLVENANRFVNIAFAEEVKMLCDKKGLDFEELRRCVNTKWNVELLEARDGIKGKCLPQDIKFLTQLGDCPLMKSAIQTDQLYRGLMAYKGH